MHCYIINLPSARKRLERTVRELSDYAPKLTWSVPKRMYVASEMGESEFQSLYDSPGALKLDTRDMSHGEIACALSHQSALREFLSSGEESCLIVEDDVLLSPAAGTFLGLVEGWLAARAGSPTCIVLSQAASVRCWTARRWLAGVRRTSPIDIYGALAYVVNRGGAELILAANPVPIKTTSDHWAYYRRHGLRVLGVNPFLAGSFDYSREESSLSAGRTEMARRAVGHVRVPFVVRKARALLYWARRAWWAMTGVSLEGHDRTNVGLFRNSERRGGPVR